MERLLERVSLSPYRDNLILKGGFLIAAMVGVERRATMDMDTTVKGLPVSREWHSFAGYFILASRIASRELKFYSTSFALIY